MRLKLVCMYLLFSVSACAPAPVRGPVAEPMSGETSLPAATAAAGLVTVSGKLSSHDELAGLSGIRVSAWLSSVQSLAEPPAYLSAPTESDGLFSLQLPPGSYYFVAEGRELYSYYGRNPIAVPRQGVADLKLSLARREPSPAPTTAEIPSGAFGRVTVAGQPLAGAVISVYVDLTSQLKGLGLGMTAPTGADGLFQMELPAGTYYLVARKRHSGSMMGPLGAGDFFGYFAGNPLRLKEGQLIDASLEMIEVPENVAKMADSMFGATSVSGRIVDNSGRPRAGVRVLLYDNSMMLNRPLFVSQPSAADGSYVLSFPVGGSYWLAARDQLGGPPLPGQLYGRYLGSPDGSVTLETGQHLTEIELVAEEMK